MARENKQARQERRFGKPERLADRIVAETDLRKWAFPYARTMNDAAEQRELFQGVISKAADSLMRCPVILAANVCSVYWESTKDVWKYKEDYPNSSPPFNTFFVESIHPGQMEFENGKQISNMPWCPDQWGAMFWAEDCDGLDFEVWDGDDSFDVTANPSGEVRKIRLDNARWEIRCIVIGYRDGLLGVLPVQAILPIGARGEMLASPTILTTKMTDESDMVEAGSMFHSLFKPILLAVSFLHCKNVVQTENRPDREIDRARRRHGLKPFVRYHTINIEPMKKILRTEGQSETEGLKRALHICRGHFSTYSEEKPLFGKVAGTFWIPAHVRGAIDKGVVISDYKVNPGVGQT